MRQPISHEKLIRKIQKRLQLASEAPVRVIHRNPAGDRVTIASNQALAEAVRLNGAAVLRLKVVTEAPSLPTAASQPKSLDGPRRRLQVIRWRQERIQSKITERPAQAARLTERLEQLQQAEAELLVRHPELRTLTQEQQLPPLDHGKHFGGFNGKFHGKFHGKPHHHHKHEHHKHEHHKHEHHKQKHDDEDESEEERKVGHVKRGMKKAERFNLWQGPSHVFCDGCRSSILSSQVRFKCAECPNFDLCASCEASNSHDPSHPMLKLRPEANAKYPHLPILRPLLAQGPRRCWSRRGLCHREEQVPATAQPVQVSTSDSTSDSTSYSQSDSASSTSESESTSTSSSSSESESSSSSSSSSEEESSAHPKWGRVKTCGRRRVPAEPHQRRRGHGRFGGRVERDGTTDIPVSLSPSTVDGSSGYPGAVRVTGPASRRQLRQFMTCAGVRQWQRRHNQEGKPADEQQEQRQADVVEHTSEVAPIPSASVAQTAEEVDLSAVPAHMIERLLEITQDHAQVLAIWQAMNS